MGLNYRYTGDRKERRGFKMRKPDLNCHPGAADPMWLRQKRLDILTCVASGIGLTTAILYLFTL